MAQDTAAKERPILFSGEMVRAILDGRKTQTRRVIKPNHAGRVKEPGSRRNWHLADPNAVLACPYGQPGDLLWVRETWSQDSRGGCLPNGEDAVYYRADFPSDKIWAGSWKPSIHMPRWASRITLRVTDVRVERVQDISEADAQAEGAEFSELPCFSRIPNQRRGFRQIAGYRAGFLTLWDSINAGRGYGWDTNPWVWALTFEREEGGGQ